MEEIVYIVWYMDKNERFTPEFELFLNPNDAVKRIDELLGKYDRIGIAQRKPTGGK